MTARTVLWRPLTSGDKERLRQALAKILREWQTLWLPTGEFWKLSPSLPGTDVAEPGIDGAVPKWHPLLSGTGMAAELGSGLAWAVSPDAFRQAALRALTLEGRVSGGDHVLEEIIQRMAAKLRADLVQRLSAVLGAGVAIQEGPSVALKTCVGRMIASSLGLGVFQMVVTNDEGRLAFGFFVRVDLAVQDPLENLPKRSSIALESRQAALSATTVFITARQGLATIKARDFALMSVGDVLVSNKKVQDRVTVLVGERGQSIASARLVQADGQLALELHKP